MALQMARNIVLGGQASVLYVCFEHDEEYLLNRVTAMESVLPQLPQTNGGVKLGDVRKEILGTWLAQGGEQADLSANPRLRPRSNASRATARTSSCCADHRRPTPSPTSISW